MCTCGACFACGISPVSDLCSHCACNTIPNSPSVIKIIFHWLCSCVCVVLVLTLAQVLHSRCFIQIPDAHLQGGAAGWSSVERRRRWRSLQLNKKKGANRLVASMIITLQEQCCWHDLMHALSLTLGACAAGLRYLVCVYVCLSVCYHTSCYIIHFQAENKVSYASLWCLLGFKRTDFAKKASFRKYGRFSLSLRSWPPSLDRKHARSSWYN